MEDPVEPYYPETNRQPSAEQSPTGLNPPEATGSRPPSATAYEDAPDVDPNAALWEIFEPNELTLLMFLEKKTKGEKLPATCKGRLHETNLYKYHPEIITAEFQRWLEDTPVWYIFTPRERKYKRGKRPARTVADETGFWKPTGRDKIILSRDGSQIKGTKKTLDFFEGQSKAKSKAGEVTKTDWKMHEYRFGPPEPESPRKSRPRKRPVYGSMTVDTCVLCCIYKKDPKVPVNQPAEVGSKRRAKKETSSSGGNVDAAQPDTSNSHTAAEPDTSSSHTADEHDISSSHTAAEPDISSSHSDNVTQLHETQWQLHQDQPQQPSQNNTLHQQQFQDDHHHSMQLQKQQFQNQQQEFMDHQYQQQQLLHRDQISFREAPDLFFSPNNHVSIEQNQHQHGAAVSLGANPAVSYHQPLHCRTMDTSLVLNPNASDHLSMPTTLDYNGQEFSGHIVISGSPQADNPEIWETPKLQPSSQNINPNFMNYSQQQQQQPHSLNQTQYPSHGQRSWINDATTGMNRIPGTPSPFQLMNSMQTTVRTSQPPHLNNGPMEGIGVRPSGALSYPTLGSRARPPMRLHYTHKPRTHLGQ